MTAFELQNIKKAYDGRTVLDIPDLSIEQGSRVALVGPNGCGKTTLLTILALLSRPDHGSVSVDGERVNLRQPDRHRVKIAFMAQEPYFFRGSLRKNMDFALASLDIPKTERAARIDKYVSMLGLDDFNKRSPRTFSTGERKRAAIARSLCRETPHLLLDEPFTHIDNTSAAVLEEVIGNLPNDRTVIFSTHDLSYAYRLADTIITLQSGRISPCTPENLFHLTAFPAVDGTELRTRASINSALSDDEKLVVYYPEELVEGRTYAVSLNPSEVLVSREPIESSARNSFRGTIKKIESSGPHTMIVTVDCPPDFPIRATLTERTMRDFGLIVGDTVWVHFKSTAVHVLDGPSTYSETVDTHKVIT